MNSSGIKVWADIVQPFLRSEEGKKLKAFVEKRRREVTVYPDSKDMLRAFRESDYPYANVRMVIVGQDPYYNGSADGLAFSCRSEVKPDSLKNVFTELRSNLYEYMSDKTWAEFTSSNSLENWAKQGILLMNTTLTVEKDLPNSHKGQGWETLTSSVIEALGREERPIAFLLWGNHAKSLKPLITGRHHLILEAAHPSPLSAGKGFFGCKHFVKAHDFLLCSDYYKAQRKQVIVDISRFIQKDEILGAIRTAIGKGQIPFDDAKGRIQEVNRILTQEIEWGISYAIDFSTKPR